LARGKKLTTTFQGKEAAIMQLYYKLTIVQNWGNHELESQLIFKLAVQPEVAIFVLFG
jgi:hypothetical protein